MDALPLPPEPDLARYRALAADEEALEAWARGLPRATPFVAASIERALAALKQPGDRELLLARAHGFARWDAFAMASTAMSMPMPSAGSPIARKSGVSMINAPRGIPGAAKPRNSEAKPIMARLPICNGIP